MRTWTLLLGWVMVFPLTALAAGDDAAKMIADFNALKPPVYDSSRREDQVYTQSYIKEQQAYDDKRAEFAKEFYSKFPNHPQALPYMQTRWQILTSNGQANEALTEIDKMVAQTTSNARRVDLLYARGMTTITAGRRGDMSAASAAIDEFIKAAPADTRGAVLLLQMAMADSDSARKTQTLKRIVASYPGTENARRAKGKLRQTEAIGTPFELSFTDAISGKPVSMANLKGKVVVIDFWATWCGPCVAEMPTMKKLYAEYKGKGVEFIGISLDQPGDGLEKLKVFVEKNGITWPQYYQGKAWSSDFSSDWGINSIPSVFVIDTAGKLHSTEARGQLGKLIPALLARRVE